MFKHTFLSPKKFHMRMPQNVFLKETLRIATTLILLALARHLVIGSISSRVGICLWAIALYTMVMMGVG